MRSMLDDFRYGSRVLRRSPGFASLAIVTLALGIGAATAVFSLVNAVLLRALPYRDPDRLVFLWAPNFHFHGVPLEAWSPFNADFYDWQRLSRSLDALALFTANGMNLATDAATIRVSGSRVTGHFFRVLGIAPELGRSIAPDDDQPGKGGVAVISHALWQSRFASSRDVLGKELLLNARPYRIIGVMPAGFAFPHGTESIETFGNATDVWVPRAMSLADRASREDNPGNAIGRLRPGVSLASAQQEMTAIVKRLNPLHPPELQATLAVLRPMAETVTGASRRSLLIFLGAVLLVLLIACGNVAGLALARTTGRARELGVRAALGASPLRLVRQLLAESLCLAAGGGLLGMGFAALAIRLLTRVNSANIPRLDEVSIDGRVLVAAIGLSLGTAIVAGLLPALSASRGALSEVLKRSGSRGIKGAGLRRGLVIGEVALTAVLLTGSGLLIRGLLKLNSADKGFDPASTLTAGISLDARYNQPQRQIAFFRDLVARAQAVPGVREAAAINFVPLGGGESLAKLQVEGQPFDSNILFEGRAITPRYFAAMGIPILQGRDFSDGDAAGRPPVVVVSRSFARRYFPAGSAVGKRITFVGDDSSWKTIVGVVADVRQRDLESTPPMQIYTPFWQTPLNRVSLVVRTSLPANRVAADLSSLLRRLDPAVALADVRTMDQLVSQAGAGRRFQTFLLTAFGGFALFLSLIGLYALVSYSVEQRTAEIGIRMALGAQPSRVLRLVLWQGAGPALSGLVLGVAGAWALTHLIASLLFEVTPTDPPVFLAVTALFAAIALGACYLPARRATRIDPLVALRWE